jgi:hypothetical protein
MGSQPAIRLARQPRHRRESHTQKIRSRRWSLGRCTDRWRTAACWRSARVLRGNNRSTVSMDLPGRLPRAAPAHGRAGVLRGRVGALRGTATSASRSPRGTFRGAQPVGSGAVRPHSEPGISLELQPEHIWSRAEAAAYTQSAPDTLTSGLPRGQPAFGIAETVTRDGRTPALFRALSSVHDHPSPACRRSAQRQNAQRWKISWRRGTDCLFPKASVG